MGQEGNLQNMIRQPPILARATKFHFDIRMPVRHGDKANVRAVRSGAGEGIEERKAAFPFTEFSINAYIRPVAAKRSPAQILESSPLRL